MLGNGVVGILSESTNKWERRRGRDKTGISRIIVQPSTKRIHHDALYEEVGCEISEDLSECGLFLGIKQPKLEVILPDRAYAFFSHTHKAQKENMPLLDKILDMTLATEMVLVMSLKVFASMNSGLSLKSSSESLKTKAPSFLGATITNRKSSSASSIACHELPSRDQAHPTSPQLRHPPHEPSQAAYHEQPLPSPPAPRTGVTQG